MRYCKADRVMHTEQPEAPDISLPLLQRTPQTERHYRGSLKKKNSKTAQNITNQQVPSSTLGVCRESGLLPSCQSSVTLLKNVAVTTPKPSPHSTLTGKWTANICQHLHCIHAMHSSFYAMHLYTLAQTSIQFLRHPEALSEWHGEWLHSFLCNDNIFYFLFYSIVHMEHLWQASDRSTSKMVPHENILAHIKTAVAT